MGERRWVVATATAGVPAVVVLVTWLAWRQRLPDPMATHWSGSLDGPPDGFGSPTASVWWMGGSCVAILAAVAVVALLAMRGRFDLRAAHATTVVLTSLGGVLAGGWLAVTTTALAYPNPQHAHLGARLLWIALLLWGAVPLVMLRRLPLKPAGLRGDLPERRSFPAVRPDDGGAPTTDRAGDSWAQTLRSRTLTVLLVVPVAVLVWLTSAVSLWLWFVLVPVAVVATAFASVDVVVDRRGLRLISTALRVPIKRIPLARIASASAEAIDPLRWGGWGYRVLPGRSALVLRTGPGLVLRLRDGRQFAVTVDDPDVPAALLDRLIPRA